MADNSHDLDELLDSALDDFNNLNLTSSSNKGDKLSSSSSSSSSLPTGVKGLGLGLPELGSKKKGKQKAVKDNHVTEALEKLREQTRETVRGLESTTAKVKGGGDGDEFGMDGMMEEWVNQFQEIAGGQDMDSVMEIMMKQLLSRDILHEPMKEIGERYPKWLEEHKSGLSKEEYDRYSHQYELITELNNVYENDPGNYSRIVDLMQKMQECGQPPNDIVRELAPDVDFSDISQLSPEMLQQAQSNCCIM